MQAAIGSTVVVDTYDGGRLTGVVEEYLSPERPGARPKAVVRISDRTLAITSRIVSVVR